MKSTIYKIKKNKLQNMSENLYKKISAFFLMFAALTSCATDELPTSPNTNNNQNPVLTNNYSNNVHVLYSSYIPSQGQTELRLWENGTSQLIRSAQGAVSLPGEMIIINNDTYVASIFSGDKAGYWKNGVVNILSTNPSAAHGIAVSGTDVYVCGKDDSRPAFWKNGVKTYLPTTFNGSFGIAKDIALIGNNIHIVGFEIDNFGQSQAKYWINGIGTNINGVVTNQYSNASKIEIVGSDIYIAGEINDKPFYYKNSQSFSLPSSLTGATRIQDLFVDNQDIYVSRINYSNNIGSYDYWKNSLQIDASNMKNTDSFAKFGNDFYLAGNNTANKVAFTQNGLENVISNYSGLVLKIIVN